MSANANVASSWNWVKDEVITTADGFQMYLDPSDNFVCKQLRETGMWEPTVRQAILDHVGPEDTFLDLGAHVGYFSLLATSRGADVIAVEPNPAAMRLLQRSARLNKFNILPILAAIAREEGVTHLIRVASNTGETHTDPDEGELVHAIAASYLASFRPTIIKFDIEGDELPVLRACPKLLDSARVVIFETHEQENPEEADELKAIMEAAGMELALLHDTRVYQDYLALKHT